MIADVAQQQNLDPEKENKKLAQICRDPPAAASQD